MKVLRPCIVITTLLLAVCCAIYPAVVTLVGQAVFPYRANGSLIEKNGKVLGSALLGQTLANPAGQPDYFWGRPSAVSTDKDTGVLVSGGSNYGAMNASLADEVDQHIKMLRDAGVQGPIPADLVTKSASGLDPDISPEAAELQVPRVAHERGLTAAVVRQLVAEHTEAATYGLLGEPRVNVLELNLALDELVPPKPPPPAPAASGSASAGAAAPPPSAPSAHP
ncbi:MAG TPA: potassium-transporting ATPase subunit KdpC [Minicystis sp.]|nr:potassium-transporting ATPase subunit KdpC [Minicystis sp.]